MAKHFLRVPFNSSSIDIMLRLTRARPPSSPFSLFQPVRHASSKSKKAAKKVSAKANHSSSTSAATTPSPYQASTKGSSTSRNNIWRIEPQISYFETRLKTPRSVNIILFVVSLSVGSTIATSLAFPDPSSKEPEPVSSASPNEKEEGEEDPSSQRPKKTFLSFLLLPLNFLLRPVLASPSEREVAQSSPLFWGGVTAGLCGLSLFFISTFATPRPIRRITITPPTPGVPSGSIWLAPYLGKEKAYPLARTTLVSPLFGVRADSKDEQQVLKTVKIAGASGAWLGWGINVMGERGLYVNGKKMGPQESVQFMERLWLSRDGKVDVAKE